jgi:hypothetical protein
VEHVVQFDTKRRTLPGLDILAASPAKAGPPSRVLEQLLHGCRQLVPWGVGLSALTSVTLILC